jgi:hypothetical protein
MFQLNVLCEKCVAALHYADIGKQLLLANSRNRVRGAVLDLSQDGACTNSCENFRENSLKRDLSNDTTVNPPLFSLVFKWTVTIRMQKKYFLLLFLSHNLLAVTLSSVLKI